MSTPDVNAAIGGFYDALNQVFAGDSTAMAAAWSHADDVTYMSPFGDLLEGWRAVLESWRQQAAMIQGGTVTPQGLRVFTADSLAVCVGFERGAVRIDDTDAQVNIRATSTFRLEGGTWLMIGHHTDRL